MGSVDYKFLIILYTESDTQVRDRLFKELLPFFNVTITLVLYRLGLNNYNTSVEELEDLKSECLLKFIEKINKPGSIDNITNVRNFFFTLAKNRILDLVRHNEHKIRFETIVKSLLNHNKYDDDEDGEAYEIPEDFWFRLKNSKREC
jgi:DNA-directed RNA polymerase specialized sigma24 family protein